MNPFEVALLHEAENRTLATLGLARPLFGRPICALTWRHVRELGLAQNAFIGDHEPSRVDVFLFLWRLHCHFIRPDGTMPNWPAHGHRPSRLACTLARFRCWWISRVASPHQLEPHIRAWVAAAFQDKPAPSGSGGDFTSPLLPQLDWGEFLAGFFADKNVIGAAFLDLPVAYTFQVYRTHLVSQGDHLRFFPPSAGLYAASLGESSATEQSSVPVSA